MIESRRLHIRHATLVSTGISLRVINSAFSVENRMLLRKDLYSTFERGAVAFLKTPNFALDLADIPTVEEGLMPPNRITLQYLDLPTARAAEQTRPVDASYMANWDARFAGTGVSPPPSIILDYLYGVAVYKRWGGRDMMRVMQQRHRDHYESIPLPAAFPPSNDDDGHESPVSDASDPNDLDYPLSHSSGRRHRSKMSTEMLDAMDDILFLSRLIKGHTPQKIAAEQERQLKETMSRAKEASQAKDQQWMQTVLD